MAGCCWITALWSNYHLQVAQLQQQDGHIVHLQLCLVCVALSQGGGGEVQCMSTTFGCSTTTIDWILRWTFDFYGGKKVKASHTCYRALGPELIPVYRQSARRWLKSSPEFPPGLQFFPATEHHCPLAGTCFTVQRRVEGWVYLTITLIIVRLVLFVICDAISRGAVTK